MVTAAEIVEAARSYKGAPYRWWTGAYPEYNAPGYMDWQSPGYYNPDYVSGEGVHCAGFVNLARMECGLSSIGLTSDWALYLWNNGGSSFDPGNPGIPGAVCCKPWTPGTQPGVAEGHIALYTAEHTLIQAVPGWGVYEGEQDYDSYTWAGYEVYGLMPDVDYSAEGVIEDAGWWSPVRVWFNEDTQQLSYWVDDRQVG